MLPVRTSTLAIVKRDHDAGLATGLVAVGAVLTIIFALWLAADGLSRKVSPPDSDVDLTVVVLIVSILMGPALLASSIAWLLKRTRVVSHLLSDGLETKAEMMMIHRPGVDGTLYVANLRYRHGDRDFDERLVSGAGGRDFWRLSRVGDRVTLMIDPENPRSFVVREPYEPARDFFERLTTRCQSCGTRVRHDEYDEHVKKKHQDR